MQDRLDINSVSLFNLHHVFDTSVSLLSGHNAHDAYSNFDSLHAFGSKNIYSKDFDAFGKLIADTHQWYFGILGYDLKNQIENLNSNNVDELGFPDFLFFEPQIVIGQKGAAFYLLSGDFNEDMLERVNKTVSQKNNQSIELTPRMTKQEYFTAFEEIQHHIAIGDFYEMNFCQEFFQKNIAVDLFSLFLKAREKVTTPFMAYFQHHGSQILSLSPERYLAKRGSKLISQPIKGTAKRGGDHFEDEANKKQLLSSLKEKTENTMIVDLVRNDLGKCAIPGSVKVTEYLKLRTYPNIHQLVSTIEAQILPSLSFLDVVKKTFPMGSMTGAPKLKVMEITEQLEHSKRGWYSGALGYIAPDGDFDFNVLIRSLIYDEQKKYLSYHVGGGITFLSNAEDEYQECYTKLHSVLSAIE